jgi:hypothetical protein
LVWRRLPDIHHRFAIQVIRFDEFRAHRSSPAGLGRDLLRSPAGALPANCARPLEVRWACAPALFGQRDQVLQRVEAQLGRRDAPKAFPLKIRNPERQKKRETESVVYTCKRLKWIPPVGPRGPAC